MIHLPTYVKRGAPGRGSVSGTAPGQPGAGISLQSALQAAVSPAFESARQWGSAPVITTPSLPTGTRSTAYSKQMAATGSNAPLTWSATGLPTGVSINASTGLISGTPTQSGDFTPTVTVIDAAGYSDSEQYAVEFLPVAPVITTGTIPAGVVGEAYNSGAIVVTGGKASLTFSATGLPGWASIDSATGAITGTPDEDDTDSVTVTVIDAAARSDDQTLSLEIAPAGFTVYEVPDDVTNDQEAYVDVIEFPVVAGATYEVLVIGATTGESTGSGHGWGFDLPSGTWKTAHLAMASSGNGGEMKHGGSDLAPVPTGSSFGATEKPSEVRACLVIGVTGGTAALQIRSEADGADATAKAGTRLCVRKAPDMKVVAGAAITHSASATYADVFSYALAANTDYLLDVALDYETAVNTTGMGVRFTDIPADCTILDTRMLGQSGSGIARVTISDDTTTLGANANATPARSVSLHRVLVRNGANAGTMKLQVTTEIDTSQITVHLGSFSTFREVTGIVTELEANSAETTTTPEVAFTLAVEADKSYLVRQSGGVTVATTAHFRRIQAPADAEIFAAHWHYAAAANDAAELARDNTEATLENTGSGVPAWTVCIVDVAGTAGDVTIEHRSDGSGTSTMLAGSFAVIEEVTVA